jgi:hypothetical protein
MSSTLNNKKLLVQKKFIQEKKNNYMLFDSEKFSRFKKMSFLRPKQIYKKGLIYKKFKKFKTKRSPSEELSVMLDVKYIRRGLFFQYQRDADILYQILLRRNKLLLNVKYKPKHLTCDCGYNCTVSFWDSQGYPLAECYGNFEYTYKFSEFF